MMKIMIVFFTHCVIILYMVWQVEAFPTFLSNSGILKHSAVSQNKCVQLDVKEIKPSGTESMNPVFSAESVATPNKRYFIKLAIEQYEKIEFKKEFDFGQKYENAQKDGIKIMEKYVKGISWVDLKACGFNLKRKHLQKITGGEVVDIIVMLDMGDTLKNTSEKNEGIKSITDIERITRNMIRSIRRLHQQNIIHRDIKPDNVCDKGKILIDFGLALDLKVPTDLNKLQYEVSGTRNYHILYNFHRFQNYFMLDYHGILMTANKLYRRANLAYFPSETINGDTHAWRKYFQNHDLTTQQCDFVFAKSEFLVKYCIWVLNPHTIQEWHNKVIKELDELQKPSPST